MQPIQKVSFAVLVLLFALPIGRDAKADATAERVVNAIPAELVKQGFRFFQVVDPGTHKVLFYRLLAPSPDMSFNLDQGTDPNFTQVKYDRAENNILYELRTSDGRLAHYEIDLASHTLKYTLTNKAGTTLLTSDNGTGGTNPVASREGEYIPSASAVTFIEKQGKAKNPLPQAVKFDWDGDKLQLRVSNQPADSQIQNQLSLHIPEGVRVRILNNRFLVMTDTKGSGFKEHKKFANSANDHTDAVAIDLSGFANSQRGNCTGFSSGVFQASSGQTFTAPLQSVVDYYTAQLVAEDGRKGFQRKDDENGQYQRLRSDEGDTLSVRKTSAGTQVLGGSKLAGPICPAQVSDKADLSLTALPAPAEEGTPANPAGPTEVKANLNLHDLSFSTTAAK